jgi:hypothetical protein
MAPGTVLGTVAAPSGGGCITAIVKDARYALVGEYLPDEHRMRHTEMPISEAVDRLAELAAEGWR